MTNDRPEPQLSVESAGLAPGHDRLRGRRIVVVGAGTRRIDDPNAPVGNGRERSKTPMLSRPKKPPWKTLRPSASLRFTHQVKFNISL